MVRDVRENGVYVHKPYRSCEMPECDQPLKALALIGTLKKSPASSNTDELARLVLGYLTEQGVQETEVIRLVDHDIPAGLDMRMSEGDKWPGIADKIRDADIVLFATPIQWGIEASPMRRCLERMDALEEEYRKTGESPVYNKVAGIVITGSEDGAQHTNGNLLNVLQFQGFTFPPEACCYWVGTVGDDPKDDAGKRRASHATDTMARRVARNLTYYARLLKAHPLVLKPKENAQVSQL